MKIIDFLKKGNVVRFYLGADDLNDWYGDDWDDIPYEHNAGTVYDEFIAGTLDVSFPFDWFIVEPKDDYHYHGNSPYCKEDFVNRDAPCIVVLPSDEMRKYEKDYGMDLISYHELACSDRTMKIYFGDSTDKIWKWKYKDELGMKWTA